MKTNILASFFVFLLAVPVYCGGLTEKNLVNIQEIRLENINSIDIIYSWENIALMKSDTDKLIVKEYMSIDNSDYYAHISNSGNKISVEKGKRPFGIGTGILFNRYSARVEVYLPMAYTSSLNIKASSGNIRIGGEYSCSAINVESSSGNIIVETVTANNIDFRATSGNISGDRINGNTNLRTTSGNINFDSINGNVFAKATSGNIRCTVTENASNISLAATSGGIRLFIPGNFAFNFHARTSSGNLSTPFSDRLFSPVSNRHLAEGAIGDIAGNISNNNINIETTSGSIRINWI